MNANKLIEINKRIKSIKTEEKNIKTDDYKVPISSKYAFLFSVLSSYVFIFVMYLSVAHKTISDTHDLIELSLFVITFCFASLFGFFGFKRDSFIKKHFDMDLFLLNTFYYFAIALFLTFILSPISILLKVYLVNFNNIINDNVIFVYCVASFCVVCFLFVGVFGRFIFEKERAKENEIKFNDNKHLSENMDKLSTEIIQSVKNLDEYHLFVSIVEENNLSFVGDFVEQIEANLIKNTAFDNFKQFRTNQLMIKVDNSKHTIDNE